MNKDMELLPTNVYYAVSFLSEALAITSRDNVECIQQKTTWYNSQNTETLYKKLEYLIQHIVL